MAGNITNQQIGDRTFIIAEPDKIDQYKQELSLLEVYLDTVENYMTEYKWVNIDF